LKYLLALSFLFLLPQSPEEFPPLGTIDLYGNRTVSAAEIRGALPFHEGDAMPEAAFETKKHAAKQKLEAIPGIKSAFLTRVCCTQDHKSMLYVGVEEAVSPCLRFHPAPNGTVRLPTKMVKADHEVEAAWEKAILAGDAAEDDSQGHALGHDPGLRAAQLRYVTLAQAYRANLLDVLHNSADNRQRALAAEVLGYVKDKQAVVGDLVAAMCDPSPEVRNNAMRTLVVFARFAPKPPAAKIRIPQRPFIELLNSCVWWDRNKSSAALAELTEQRDPALLAKMRKEALPSLMEMARWKDMGHAASSLLILGRIGGLSDEQMEKALETGDREAILEAAGKAGP